ncbi:glycosyltransferase family 2 protein [Cesiribacter andamanensis]|uniref:Undecaprenyl-phosphate 4-deoxy-4-formamido-L-arabinose transferase n=1 Tax=Cesiribacter andamanensis AMV16 TaxID=1279009 RepID=M7N6Q4_9BACT|nr:glycosyltransferase family 2 protein [Cesiribacter andamanensis]EMR04268.1 Undecaprenyl-phosphate 4-deoxy-4-formamido-L-arabinose transferase [Cesiribacter andamanensis AMV16]
MVKMSSPSPVHISVISPVYGAVATLPELVHRVSHALQPLTSEFEIILVDDRGPGPAWETITALAGQHSFVRGVRLSRNFGQHYAITAGLEHARGEWVVVMDCDLQDVPEEIPHLYAKAREGYDAVLARRAVRQDGFFKRTSSLLFYRILSYLTGVPYDNTVANFGIYHARMITAIVSMGDKIRYFPSMVSWVGFAQTSLDVKHASRAEGNSAYNFAKLLRLALDIILSFSDKPLRLTVKLGTLISLFSLVGALIVIIQYLRGAILVMGYASLIVSIWLLAGIVIALIGVVGLYIGKIFEAVKNRPVYIVADKVNGHDHFKTVG